MLLQEKGGDNPTSYNTLRHDGSVEQTTVQAPHSTLDYASMTNTFKVSHLV